VRQRQDHFDTLLPKEVYLSISKLAFAGSDSDEALHGVVGYRTDERVEAEATNL
jgi:hypothetical protein